MDSPAVTSRGPKDEPYDEFTRRVAEDAKRVKAKCDALNEFVPFCGYCGETCDQINAGQNCKENNATMASRWARETAEREWYRLGHFGGSWSTHVENLACLLDRARASATPGPTREGT